MQNHDLPEWTKKANSDRHCEAQNERSGILQRGNLLLIAPTFKHTDCRVTSLT
jgi:hypothetical protein